MIDFLLKVVEKTNGWVIVVVFALYISYQIFNKTMEHRALNKTLGIIENNMTSLFNLISQKLDDIKNILSEIS